MTLKKILCAVDFSDASHDALRDAAELARTSQALLVILHVWQPPQWMTYAGIELPTDAQLEARAGEEAKLASWRSDAQQLCADARTKLARGVPWDEIVATA